MIALSTKVSGEPGPGHSRRPGEPRGESRVEMRTLESMTTLYTRMRLLLLGALFAALAAVGVHFTVGELDRLVFG